MKCSILCVLVLAAHGAETNPIGKVVQMISDLQGKVIAEGESSHKIYSEFAEFCEDRARDLGFEIKTGKARVAELTAAIEEEDATIGSLSAKIEDLSSSVATDEKDLKAATEVRAKEAADFAAEEKELTEVIDTLGRAIAILEREMQGGASMLQLKNAKDVVSALTIMVQASAFNAADASRITALVQNAEASDDEDAGAPAAAVYESHSGGIVDTLQGLADKAEGQLADARKKETTSLHNFEMLKQSLEDSMKFANEDMAEAKKGLAEAGEKKATAEGDLEVTSKDLKADEEALNELHHDCMSKAEDYEAETKSRGEELAALAKAKQVIEDATGGAEKIAYGFEQASFLQRSSTDVARFEAVRYVRDLARKQKSPQLAQLASRMASAMHSSADPFAKVTGLISDMIARLEAEAEADATEKAYCDKELSETNAKKDDKDAEIAKLTTQIDQKTAKSAQLKEEVAALQKNLADIAKAQAEMDKLRQEENAAYVSNKADLEQGVEGVKLALKVLRDYYSKDAAHQQAEGASSGIIGLLEVCESDFSKDLAEVVSTEETAAAEYERATKENEVETAAKTQDVKYKTQESVALDKAVAEATSDRSGVQEELDAVLEYLDKLKERCVAKAETYADRKAARDAEIAGLKQAAEILDGQGALLQTKRSFLRRKSKLDINQKVYIENAPVLGDGAGDGALNNCRALTAAHVANEDAPVVKVCGTGIKATVFLRGRCEGYYEHSVTVGKCNTGAPPSTCDVYSPADKAAFGHYQSYKIEQC